MTGEDDIIILCSSGYAAEVASVCAALQRRVAAIVGTGTALDAAATLGLPAISWTGDLASLPAGDVALALGDGSERRRIRELLALTGRRPMTLVHPEATVGLAVVLGDGCIVSPGARLTANLTVGAGTLINTGAILSHDDQIGSDVSISPGVTVCGGVTIEDDAWVAAGATVLPGVTIGEGAVVGAHALVTKDVPAGTTVAGIPAKPLRR